AGVAAQIKIAHYLLRQSGPARADRSDRASGRALAAARRRKQCAREADKRARRDRNSLQKRKRNTSGVSRTRSARAVRSSLGTGLKCRTNKSTLEIAIAP